MTLQEWVHTAITIAAVGQTLFVLLYSTAFRLWRKDIVGRALFAKALTLALILDVAVVAIWWFVDPVVFVVLYWLIAASIWLQFFALVSQRAERRRKSRR